MFSLCAPLTPCVSMAAPLLPCGPCMVWHAPLAQEPFESTTGFFVDTPALWSFQSFIRARRGDRYVFVCLDAPGMGKTQTVVEGARRERAVYARYDGGTGILESARIHLLLELTDAASKNGGVVVASAARDIAVRTWKAALATCLLHAAETLREHSGELHLGFLPRNGVEWTNSDPRTVEAFVEHSRGVLRNAVNAISRNSTVVLHFDEVQALLRHEGSQLDGCVPTHDPIAPCAPSECMRHVLVWFSEALRAVCPDALLKPCITGISVSAVDGLRFDSGMKIWPAAPLPYFDKTRVKSLLRNYVRFSADSDGARAENAIAAAASGCPRAVQYVLLVLHSRARSASVGEHISSCDVPGLLRAARGFWQQSGSGSFLQATDAHAKSAVSALMATAFPIEKGGCPCEVDGVAAAEFPTARITREWREAANAGALRLRVSGKDQVVMFPPYPFLEHYLNSVGTRQLSLEHCVELVMVAHTLPAWTGVFGRGKAFEYALASELCLFSSPVLRRLLQCDGLMQLGLFPFADDGACVLRSRSVSSELPSDAELNSSAFAAKPCVFVVRDGQVGCSASARPGDIGVPVRIPTGVGTSRCVLLLIEVKSGSDERSRGPVDYARSGLTAFVKLSSSEIATAWPLSCFVCTVDVSQRRRRRVRAMVARAAYNASNGPSRAMGLFFLDGELQAQSVLNLGSVLHSSDAGADASSAERWRTLLFEDAVMRRRVSGEVSGSSTDARRETASGDVDFEDEVDVEHGGDDTSGLATSLATVVLASCSCGGPIKPSDKFCSNCGTDLRLYVAGSASGVADSSS